MSAPTLMNLRHPQGDCALWLGEGALEAARQDLEAWVAGRSLFVVSSPRIRELHGGALESWAAAAARLTALDVPEGEEAKELTVVGRLWDDMLVAGGKRDSRVVAFGGGSVGDLAGFAAGCFLRGVEVVQVPTTLLAQVDAAIGGKTGINLAAAKNSVGVFWNPRMVVADPRFLNTLPAAELRSGLVEALKAGILADGELVERIEADLERLIAGDAAALGEVVRRAAAVKVGVVERDPLERGERKLLNLGHTLAHALETGSGYGALLHGEAVAYGILFALRLAERRGFDRQEARRLRRLLSRFELPPLPALSPPELVRIMGRDKKRRESGLVWVLPVRIGEARLVESVGGEEVLAELASFLDDPYAAAPGAAAEGEKGH